MIYSKEEREQLFWEAVDIRGPHDCWRWKLSYTRDGYGKVRYFGKVMGTHRAAWIITYGAIPKKKQILHKCDHRWCVNPAHLFLGTHKDNIRDMISKGRQGKVTHQTRKLTYKKAQEIRAKYSDGETVHALARKYRITPRSVRGVINFEYWLPPPPTSDAQRGDL